jgi:hypothetical protein
MCINTLINENKRVTLLEEEVLMVLKILLYTILGYAVLVLLILLIISEILNPSFLRKEIK